MMLPLIILAIAAAIALGLALTGHGSDADWTDWPRDEVEW